MAEGIIKALNSHFEALRLFDRVHRSGKQLSLKVLEQKLAQVDVDSAVKETQILAGQARIARMRPELETDISLRWRHDSPPADDGGFGMVDICSKYR